MSISENMGNPDSQYILVNNTIEDKLEHLSIGKYFMILQVSNQFWIFCLFSGDYSRMEIKLTFVERNKMVSNAPEVAQEPVKAKDLFTEGKKLGKMFSKFQFPS